MCFGRGVCRVIDILKLYRNFERIYEAHNKTNSKIIIIGDLNCDDLPDQDKNSIAAKLRSFYRQYQFKQLIKELS